MSDNILYDMTDQIFMNAPSLKKVYSCGNNNNYRNANNQFNSSVTIDNNQLFNV